MLHNPWPKRDGQRLWHVGVSCVVGVAQWRGAWRGVSGGLARGAWRGGVCEKYRCETDPMPDPLDQSGMSIQVGSYVTIRAE